MMTTKFTEVTQGNEFLALELVGVTECLEACADTVHHDELVRGACRWLQYDTASRAQFSTTLFERLRVAECSASMLIEVLNSYASFLDISVLVTIKIALANIAQSQLSVTMSCKHSSEQAGTKLMSLLPKGKVLIIGFGHNPSTRYYNNVFWILDQHGQYKRLTQIPTKYLRHKCTCFEMPHGFAIVGGVDGKSCSVYDSRTNIWSDLPQLSQAIHLVCYHQQQIITGIMTTVTDSDYLRSSIKRPAIQFDYYSQHMNGWINQSTVSISSLTSWSDTDQKAVSFQKSVYFSANGKIFAAKPDKEEIRFIKEQSSPSLDSTSPVVALDRIYQMGGPSKACSYYNPHTREWKKRNQPSLHSQEGRNVFASNLV